MVEELDLRGERLQYKRLLDLKEWMNCDMSKKNKVFGNGLSGCDPVTGGVDVRGHFGFHFHHHI